MPAGFLPILSYHSIDTSGSVISTSPLWFSRTMRSLLDSGFEPVDLLDWLSYGGQGNSRQFAVTFDDGLASTLYAAETLSKLGIPATMFLVTGHMGGRNDWPGQPPGIPRFDVLSWRDVRALRSSGIRFGAHTRTHPDLRGLPLNAVRSEIQASQADIESALGEPCPLFAYPYGFANTDIKNIAASYFNAALGTRLDLASESDDRFQLPRLDAYYLRGPRSLEALISGRWHAHSRLARWLRSARQAACLISDGRFLARLRPAQQTWPVLET